MPDTDESEFGLWQTPTVADSINRKFRVNSRGEPKLSGQVKLWPTATANDAKGSTYQYSRGDHSKPVLKLPGAVKLWPTPSANELRTMDKAKLTARREQCKAKSQNGNGFGLTLGNAMTMAGESGQLNPEWVEWLMGYPIGHTACADSETPSFRKSQP